MERDPAETAREGITPDAVTPDAAGEGPDLDELDPRERPSGQDPVEDPDAAREPGPTKQ